MHQLAVDVPEVPGIGGEQTAIAQAVDQARHPAGQPVDLGDGSGTEDFRPQAGDAQAVADVALGLLAGHRLEVEAGRDALVELAQVLALEHLPELRLADQDDLQQLVLGGLQVGQQPHLFEHRRGQVLGLVDDQHRTAPLGVGVEQVPVEGVDKDLEALGLFGVGDSQLVADAGHQLGLGQPGIEDQRDIDGVGELFDHAPADHRLAGPHLAGQQHEAAPLVGPVQQVGQRLLVPGAGVQVARVGGQRERGLFDAEVFGIHGPYTKVR